MPSHKISPKIESYFSRSFDFFWDLVFFLLGFGLLLFFHLHNITILIYFALTMAIFLVIYLIKVRKGESVYFVYFFSQPIIFFLITPIAFLKLEILAIVILVGAGITYSKKSFRYLDFPFSVFLSVFSVMLSIVAEKFRLSDFFLRQQELHYRFTASLPEFSGIFFSPSVSFFQADDSLFSVLENYGLIFPVIVSIFFLRKRFLWDFGVLVLIACSFIAYFIENVFLFSGRELSYVAIWYFLYISPGRNHRALFFESICSAFLTFLFAVIVDPYRYPAILLILIFFGFRSILVVFKQKRIFQDRGVLKTGKQ